VSANAAGFKKVIKTVTVILGTSTTVNLQPSLSSQNESVEVTDEVTGVQTEDANLQTNFNGSRMELLYRGLYITRIRKCRANVE
jgi:hypothetical protein